MNGFALLPGLVAKARRSRFWLGVLNQLLGRLIPFNRPHGFRVAAIETDRVRTLAPYRRRNFNHVRGLHACGIATVAEFSAGLLLLTRLDPTRFRLLMAGLEVEYLYQGRSDLTAETILDQVRLEKDILEPLAATGTLVKTLETNVSDRQGNLVARARTTWQIKDWELVRTRTA